MDEDVYVGIDVSKTELVVAVPQRTELHAGLRSGRAEAVGGSFGRA
jgi:hypothetical protein